MLVLILQHRQLRYLTHICMRVNNILLSSSSPDQSVLGHVKRKQGLPQLIT